MVILIYDYFYPDFTAGGPITALGNLSRLIEKKLNIRIVTSSYEYKSHIPLKSTTNNKWISWHNVPIFYSTSVWRATNVILSLGGGSQTTLYLNGIFSWRYFLIPLLCAWIRRYKVIISPRGMLQAGALRSHAIKKLTYLTFLKWSGLLRKSTWHATDEQERLDILNRITSRTNIVVVSDVPLVSECRSNELVKREGQLNLVYFSLIAEKKNLLFTLELLNSPELYEVRLDIIGPVKDNYYWIKCLGYIAGMNNPDRISYKGDIRPEQVSGVLSNYHAMILTTHGENFGHAIIEMLSVGRPVFISDRTPWKDITKHQAGYSLPLRMDDWIRSLMEALHWDQASFNAICLNARGYYENAFDFNQIRDRYIRMFEPMLHEDRSVVLAYDHFYPDFSAGGPVSSLGNLAQLLKDEIPLRILTSSYHYKKAQTIAGITLNQWTSWRELPVWYATNLWSVITTLLRFKKGNRTILYLNGIFSIRYFLLPLMFSAWRGYRVIVSPRGMLQEGALQSGKLKKQTYLSAVKFTQLLKHVVWHATDKQESDDIKIRIGAASKIFVISNVPIRPLARVKQISKSPGELHLVYYSLISEKKNLNFFLQLLEHPSLSSVKLDIIGPVKDDAYWRNCCRTINQMRNPGRINYRGEFAPDKSLELLQEYHGLVLPTRGENFGHAIVEMLAVSRPVLISDKTPWNSLSLYEGGIAVPLRNEEWINALEILLSWTDSQFQQASAGALRYYHNNFDFTKLKKDYIEMFSNVAS